MVTHIGISIIVFEPFEKEEVIMPSFLLESQRSNPSEGISGEGVLVVRSHAMGE